MRNLFAIALLCLALPCSAQDAKTPAVVAPDAAASAATAEPNVRRVVIEDEGSRIEELRVRGTTQRIVVTPKVVTTKSYEIIMGDGSQNLTDGINTSRGATGKRVWNVLNF